ncbi:hypothetical protein BC939DRAFT_472320 [Gamsiella multidivaricata]|uniref:uncharacterized protein n=1 Tax=Gamsiella multidivaricata TaxID=101098 RepID=UPI00221E625C|nr:uncharacterized protein BC939DRAFT_472320 [Gamsiella multidivaricata]KAG0366934.1 hypothetical protein BGZ54_004680 [Gamsiella multidivaricata]KAI7832735.1 hypothetical protein BC939DRAFT_472320 [Gamsiella multidivaricata]
MAISFDFTMFDTTNPKLSKSADALESALAQFGKHASVNDDIADSLFADTPAVVSNSGSGFDEWLANDFQLGALSGDDISSSLSSSPCSALDDSPLLGLDSFSAAMGQSLFDVTLGFPISNNLAMPVVPTPAPIPVQVKAAPLLTTAAVQQAAAALNIPWSHDLEMAVLAQAASQASASASAPAAAFPIDNACAMIIPKVEPVEKSFASAPTVDVSKAKDIKKRAFTPEDDMDEIVAKRAKNTDAARRSRLKKMLRLETLETKVAELEATNNRLTMKVAILETEKNGHLSKEVDQSARIAQLEAKLAEAHAALTSRA